MGDEPLDPATPLPFETPGELLARLKLGREEFCQRLLTTLLLHGPYPRWNTRSALAPAGVAFLRDLYGRSFGSGWPESVPVFVDEFELPPRHDAERGGAPDYAVLWDDRLWLIELKTEKASHRAAQIPGYFELAHHHYPAAHIDLTYITPPMTAPHEPDPDWARYAHITWEEVGVLVRSHWAKPSHPGQQEVVDGLLGAIDSLHLKPTEWRAALAGGAGIPSALEDARADPVPALASPVDQAMALAAATAQDGIQRALDFVPMDLEDLLAVRLALRDRLSGSSSDSPLRHVMPWIWRLESTGTPLTTAGEVLGVELRLSRYAAPIY